jgi:hypothetical protein
MILYVHIGLMVASVFSMFAAVSVARYFKKNKWWFKVHKGLNGASVGLALTGFAVAAIMVQQSGGPHFRVGHGVLGAFVLILVLIAPTLGFAIFKSKNKSSIPTLKKAHRWLGRTTAIGMAITAIVGLSLIGLI